MAPASPPSVALLAGPQLLGLFFNWALQGVLIVQVYIYHTCFQKDSLALRLFVYGVLIFEIVQTGLVTEFAFDIYVYDYGNVASLIAFHNTWFSSPIMEAMISAAVQIFFAWRIYIVSKTMILAGGIAFLSFSQMTLGIVGGAMLKSLNPSSAELSVVTPILGTWISLAGFTDLVIAIAMTTALLKAKSGIKRTDSYINRVVRLVVETGIMTATVAIVNAVLFTAVPSNLLYQCPALIVSKVYANTLVSNLNSRAFHGNRIVTDGTSTMSSHAGAGSRAAYRSRNPSNIGGPGTVMVDVRQETYIDEVALEETSKRVFLKTPTPSTKDFDSASS
ncbi:hypothetical protein B0H21DRAFT_810767 [Amylocystis lapponica]|nr:hypothetical protein B0H21DRAFT_810767 [Amylocystis lapponica]